MDKIILLSVSVLLAVNLFGQDKTIGLMLNTEASFNGYTLLAPTSSKQTFLIDNCGQLINTWNSNVTPGMVAYLREDGSLLRAGRIFAQLASGGSGGRLEIISWDDKLLWAYEIANDTMHLHHDVEPLSNGNILVIAWDKRSDQEVIAAGRDPLTIGQNGIWFESILELRPIGTDSAEIIWQWNLFDHLVQDRDSTLDNYGEVYAHPELLDINYRALSNNNPGNSDWIHLNSIDYNPTLDQILISSRSMDEIYIIDHSTTTEEAEGHTGGKSGMGGDFLYRWGNPQTYRRGSREDQQLFGQHDAHWIETDAPDAGKIMVFNNGNGRPEGRYSSVDIIDPPLEGNTYTIADSLPYSPSGPDFSFSGHDETAFYSNRISGAGRLPNGNLLICSGNEGRIFEVNADGQLVWDYINPVNQFGPGTQGTDLASNDLFRAYRYSPDFPAFDGRDLFPGPVLELNPFPETCMIYETSPVFRPDVEAHDITVFPNPANEFIYFSEKAGINHRVRILDPLGQEVRAFDLRANDSHMLDVSLFLPGIYFVQVRDGIISRINVTN